MGNSRKNHRLLIVSPSFPPINTPDMQRVRLSLPYYRDYGWEPFVLATDTSTHDGPREEALLAGIPTDVEVCRVPAFSLSWTRWFGIRNLGLRSWFRLFFAGSRIIRRHKIDLVFLSNTQFVTFTLGRLWSIIHSIPYVIDLQDPWRTDYYEQAGAGRPPGGWKYQIARVQARLLEGWSFQCMSGMISVSPQYISDLKKRYAWFGSLPSATIPFGTSEADLKLAQNTSDGTDHDKNTSTIRLIYTGAAGPITPYAVELLFRAFRRFLDQQPDAAKLLRLEFCGTSYASTERAQPSILPLAEKHGISKFVKEHPARIGTLQAMSMQLGADGLLMLGSTDPAYSPSKLYPYFLTGRPMLGLVLNGSVLEGLLRSLNCAHLVTYSVSEADARILDPICAFFANACARFPTGTLPARNNDYFCSEFLAPALTARQCALFDIALKFRDAS